MCFISRYPFSSLMRVFQRNTTNPRQVPRRCLPLGKSTDCKKRSASLLRSYPRASFHSFPGFPSVASVRETCGTAPIQVGPETDVDNSFADFRFSLFYSTFFLSAQPTSETFVHYYATCCLVWRTQPANIRTNSRGCEVRRVWRLHFASARERDTRNSSAIR